MATSTFAATQERIISTPEPAPVEQPVTPVVPEVVLDAPEPTPVNNPTPEPAVTPETPVQEEDSAEFKMEFGELDSPAIPVSPVTSSFNIDEEIKKVDPKELLKKAGVSDFVIDFDTHLKNGGNAIDYLQAKAIDYTKVSDEDLIKSDLKKQYPNLSKEHIDLMFERNYGVDEHATEDEKEFSLVKMSADGYKIRQAKIEEQQRFKLPDAVNVKDEAYEQWKAESQNAQKNYEETINFFNNHTATKSLNESKKVTISLGEGVKPFNFKLSKPELITQALTDDGTIMKKLLSTETGEPDVAKQHLVTLFAFNPQGFIQALFDYGASMGTRKKLVDDNQNAQRPQSPVVSMPANEKPVFKQGTFGALNR